MAFLRVWNHSKNNRSFSVVMKTSLARAASFIENTRRDIVDINIRLSCQQIAKRSWRYVAQDHRKIYKIVNRFSPFWISHSDSQDADGLV